MRVPHWEKSGRDWWNRHASTLPVRSALAALALLLTVVVAACWIGVALLGALPGDAQSAVEVREQRLSWLALAPARALDWSGHTLPALVVVTLLALWLWYGVGWRHAVLLAVAGAGAAGLTWLIKQAVGRSRPAGSFLHDPSFPSGHTIWAVTVFGMLGVLALQRRRWRSAAVCLVIVAVMGPSRVLLGVHWLSDVVAGYAIGFAWLIGLLLVGMPWAAKDRRIPAPAPREHAGSRRVRSLPKRH